MDNLGVKNECGICPTKIRVYDGIKLKKTPEYNEVVVKLNDLSKMVIGVCNKHTKPQKKDLNTIMKKTKQGWLEEIALGIGNKRWVMDIGSKLQVVGVEGG